MHVLLRKRRVRDAFYDQGQINLVSYFVPNVSPKCQSQNLMSDKRYLVTYGRK